MSGTAALGRIAALTVSGIVLAATALAQQALPPVPPDATEIDRPAGGVNRTVVDAPLAPGPGATGDGELGLQGDAAPVGLNSGLRPSQLVHVPVTSIYPGAVRPRVELAIPDLEDEERIWRGKRWFVDFNCAGCHAPHGGGGMGPSLSNTTFKYGAEPENIFLSILQGRPLGMPVWGGYLPDHVIWDLVAYVRRIARNGEWGRTTSLEAMTIEQIPSQYIDTIEPWEHTTGFSYGQPPFEKVDVPEKEEPDDAAPAQ